MNTPVNFTQDKTPIKDLFFKKTEEKKIELNHEENSTTLTNDKKFTLKSICCDIDRHNCLSFKSIKKK